MALDTSPEQPAPVRVISQAIGQWVGRLGSVWVEGQIAQLNQRPGTRTAFLTLRDPVAELSLNVTCRVDVLDAMPIPPTDGARVVVHAKPTWYHPRGQLQLVADDIRPVGLGDLLARIERLRRILAAEGVFDDRHKRPLPFLPRAIGVVCGRDSKAEHDVVENSRRRWPGVRFRIEPAAVQGTNAVVQITEALRVLERDPEVDVVVVARGGGSVEDLLPFSDETLIRAVAAMRTPVVSAIGHESDGPLFDLVADVRASTPTDAAKLLVPDVTQERARAVAARDRVRSLLRIWLDRETAALASVRSRPALADPGRLLEQRVDDIESWRDRARRSIAHQLDRHGSDVAHTVARIRALSPLATLERGYAVATRADGVVVRDPGEVVAGDLLTVRVAGGAIPVTVNATSPEPPDAHRDGHADGRSGGQAGGRSDD